MITEKEPVFIVGAPRSGTTLLAATLGAHSQMYCGPETHFFRRLAEVEAARLTQPVDWPEPAAEFIFSISHTNFPGEGRTPLIEKYQLSKGEVRTCLVQQPPSIQAILSAVTVPAMQREHKTRWVEKTPDHITQVEQIRAYFPQSPIIRILRDPRDVALSLTKVPWGAETFWHALVAWKQVDLASNPFFEQDQRSYTLHFEDLLSDPTATLEKICAFLGESYEAAMLDTASSGKQLNSRSVTWKAKASQPIDRSRLGVWRSELRPHQKILAEALIGDRILAHGYELEQAFEHFGVFIPNGQIAPKYVTELETLPITNVRFWKLNEKEQATVKVFLGDPSGEKWFCGGKFQSSWKVGRLALQLLLGRLGQQRIYWLNKENRTSWTGYSAALLKKLLKPYKVITSAS